MTHVGPRHVATAIRNGTVIDGTGKGRFAADVSVGGDRIVGVGDLAGVTAEREIDAGGCIVCPGFIDVHAHDDAMLLLAPDMTAKISQGVTSVVAGNCGFSLAPLEPGAALPQTFRLLGESANYRFPTFSAYLDAVAAASPAVNYGLLVGHSTLRRGAMDDLGRGADEGEIATMRDRLAASLEAGAIGFSTGLDYDTNTAATTDEVAAIAEVVRPHGGLYATHTRDYLDDIEGAIEEALEIGRRAGVAVVLSHHQVEGHQNVGRSAQTLALIERAVEHQQVGLDAYPYTAGATILIPELVEHCERVVVSWSDRHPDMAGRDLAEVAAKWGCDQREAARRLIPGGAIYFNKDEADVRRVLAYPLTMIGSDGLPHERVLHPRLWGTFPRILGRYVRELGVLELEDAVRRMTGLAAERFGFSDRGVLRPGAYADLVVFDPETIIDRATYAQPELPADGIRFVMINGVAAWRDGAGMEERAGRLLRREPAD